ncbi:MAG TPA: sugar ABC transporter permease [Clostridiaceae bacterium]|nr:sugar ABC transporter permease [Clostridiaceae bacterium]
MNTVSQSSVNLNFFGKVKKFVKSNIFYEQVWGYIFILPSLIFFIIFVIYPVIEALILSLYQYSLQGSKWVGLANYATIFKDSVFIKSLINTFLFVLYIVPTTVILSIVIAVLIYDKSPRAQTFFRASFYLPVVISIVSVSLVWRNIYHNLYGILNYVLSFIGIDPINWLGDPKYVIPSLSIVVLTYSLGQPIILYLAALGGIPQTYYEAADIDGASGIAKFWNITVPLLTPTTLYIFVTTTIGAFQVFAVVNLMTSGGPNYASNTVLFLIYKTAFTYNDFSLASTMGVIMFVCVAIFAVIQFKMFSSQVEY